MDSRHESQNKANFPLRSVQDKAIKEAEQGMDEGRNNKLLQALHLNVLLWSAGPFAFRIADRNMSNVAFCAFRIADRNMSNVAFVHALNTSCKLFPFSSKK